VPDGDALELRAGEALSAAARHEQVAVALQPVAALAGLHQTRRVGRPGSVRSSPLRIQGAAARLAAASYARSTTSPRGPSTASSAPANASASVASGRYERSSHSITPALNSVSGVPSLSWGQRRDDLRTAGLAGDGDERRIRRALAQDDLHELTAGVQNQVWFASAKSWSSPATQNTGTTGTRRSRSRRRASAMADSAL